MGMASSPYTNSTSSVLCYLSSLAFARFTSIYGEGRSEKRSIGQKYERGLVKKYARSTFMLWLLWFTVVFSYYGMFLWLPSVMVGKGFDMITSFKYVLIMTLAQLPGYFTVSLVYRKVWT